MIPIRIYGNLDEAPQAYKNIENVLQEQGNTIKILYKLKPEVVVMAGPEDFDPYKD